MAEPSSSPTSSRSLSKLLNNDEAPSNPPAEGQTHNSSRAQNLNGFYSEGASFQSPNEKAASEDDETSSGARFDPQADLRHAQVAQAPLQDRSIAAEEGIVPRKRARAEAEAVQRVEATTAAPSNRVQRHPAPESRHSGGERLEPSIFGVAPDDAFVVEIANWLWQWGKRHQNIEIEAKLGRLIDPRTKSRMVLPVGNETILTNNMASFESNMTLNQHAHFNRLLNARVEEQKHASFRSSRITYRHIRQRDSFHTIPGPPTVKVRVSTDSTTNELLGGPAACVVKSRVADMDVYSPQNVFDYRISLRTEDPVRPPNTPPESWRNKDRLSYVQQMTSIDLTQVTPSYGKAVMHELEIEIANVDLLFSEAYKHEQGQPSMYLEMISSFVNNIRISFQTTHCKMGVTVKSLGGGDGQNYPKSGDTVTMHYTGTLESGKKFDSSVDRNKPFVTKIGVGQVIKGWDEGVPQLSLGEKAILTCTPDYAYGTKGYPPIIPANSTLNFEVELLKIN